MASRFKEHEYLMSATAHVMRERRMLLGLSQEELSTRSGLHRTYISDIELAKRNISLLNLLRLSSALQIPASEILHQAQDRVVIEQAAANPVVV